MFLEIITSIFNSWKKKYGSPRIYHELKALGDQIGKNRVARIMRENGQKSSYSRPRKSKTTNSEHDEPVSPNILNQNFQVQKPNTVWVSDITYIPSKQG